MEKQTMSLLDTTEIYCEIENENIKYLKLLIDTCSILLKGNRTLRFTKKGMLLQALIGKSGFVFLEFKKSFFGKLELSKEIFDLTFDLKDIKKVLQHTIKEDEYLTMSYITNSESFNSFVMRYAKKNSKAKRTRYELAIHPPKDEEMRADMKAVMDSIPLEAKIIFNGGNFSTIMGDIAIAQEKGEVPELHIEFNSTDAVFTIKNLYDTFDAHYIVPMNDTVSEIVLKDSEIHESKYDMSILEDLSKIDGIAKHTIIESGSDKPIRINFDIIKGINFMFVIAPLLDEDTDDEEEEEEEDE